MNDANWRIFQLNLQFENNSSNWLGFALFCLWMMQFNDFSLPENSMVMKSVKIDDTDTRFEDGGNILISFFQVLFQTTAKQLRLTSANFDFGLADSSPFNEKSNVFSPTHNTFLSVQAQCLKITYFNPIEIWLIFLWNQSG